DGPGGARPRPGHGAVLRRLPVPRLLRLDRAGRGDRDQGLLGAGRGRRSRPGADAGHAGDLLPDEPDDHQRVGPAHPGRTDLRADVHAAGDPAGDHHGGLPGRRLHHQRDQPDEPLLRDGPRLPAALPARRRDRHAAVHDAAAVGVHADRLDAAADGLVGAGRPARSRGPGALTPPPPRFAARPESAVRAENDATGEREGDDVTEAAADIADLAGTARRDLPEVLADLRRLVEHETPSSDKELLDAGLDDIEEWLAERLGPPASRVRHGGGAHGDGLELGYPGTGAGTVLLLCHYDTVWPRGTIREWPVTVDGDRFSGPGCFDMKAGIVQGVWALRALRELGLPAPAVRILLNGDEEIGSPASRAHIERAGAEADLTLVLEPSRAGKVKTG